MQQIRHGGIREDASIDDINLAYKLEDGMKIHIPTIQEKENEKKEANNSNIIDTSDSDLTQKYVNMSSGLGNDNQSIKDTDSSNNNTKVNINVATQTQLETLPGIGPTIAMKIIEYRKEKGNFKKIEDIKNVNGIGDSKFENIKEFITVK